MKDLKKILLMLTVVFWLGCSEDQETPEIELPAPTEVEALIDIATDDSGLVTITPSGEGVASYTVFYGVDPNEEGVTVEVGSSTSNTYMEGDYTLTVVATNADGKTTTITKDVSVSFTQPSNVAVDVQVAVENSFMVTITPSADDATVFEVLFGDEADGDLATMVTAGDSVMHEYTAAGDYTITVIAKGASATTVSITEAIMIEASADLLLPIDFENASVNYTLADFEGAASQVIDNPNINNDNPSAKVGQTVKTDGAQTFAGTIITLTEPIDFSIGNGIKLKVYSPKAGATLRMKLENLDDGNIFAEVDALTTVADAWETLSFNFSGVADGTSLQKIILFQDFGNPGDDSVYLFDDIEQFVTEVAAKPVLPVDFEDTSLMYDIAGFGAADFGAIPAQLIPNPGPDAVNGSATVLEIHKTGGAQVFAGASLKLESAIDFSAGNTISVDVWTPRADVPVLLKIEDSTSPLDGNGNPTVFAEVQATATQAGMWQTVSFDMSTFGAFDPNINYDTIIFFPDFGSTGADERFYFDNAMVGMADNGGGTGAAFVVPADFESMNITYDFGGFEGADSAIEDNPVAGGINTSARVIRSTKTVGAQFFAGTSFNFAEPLDLSVNKGIAFKSYSPKADIPIRIALENQAIGGDSQVVIDVNTTVANEWEEIVADFTNVLAAGTSYDRIVVFYEFVVDLAGDGTTYYYDDFQVVSIAPPAVSIDYRWILN